MKTTFFSALVLGIGLGICPLSAQAQTGTIAFSSDFTSPSNHELFSMGANGANLKQLTFNTGINDLFPAFSADGSKIAYYRGPATYTTTYITELFVMNADGSAKSRVAYANTYANDPTHSQAISKFSFSPDGKYIAYTIRSTPNPAPHQYQETLVVVNVATGALRGLFTPSANLEIVNLHWTPDSTQIVFSAGRTLWKVKPTGSLQKVLTLATSLASDFKSVAAAPGSTKVAYSVKTVAGGHSIYEINLDGTNNHLLRTNAEADFDQLIYTPDGNKIVYYGLPVGTTQSQFGYHLLTLSKSATSLIVANGAYAVLSPDGQYLAFSGDDNLGNPQLRRIKIDGTGNTLLKAFGGSLAVIDLPFITWGPGSNTSSPSAAKSAFNGATVTSSANGS